MGKVKEMTGVCQGDDGVIAFFKKKKKSSQWHGFGLPNRDGNSFCILQPGNTKVTASP